MSLIPVTALLGFTSTNPCSSSFTLPPAPTAACFSAYGCSEIFRGPFSAEELANPPSTPKSQIRALKPWSLEAWALTRHTPGPCPLWNNITSFPSPFHDEYHDWDFDANINRLRLTPELMAECERVVSKTFPACVAFHKPSFVQQLKNATLDPALVYGLLTCAAR